MNKEIQKIKPSGIFTNYIYKTIPLAFDESMSYYETLCGILSLLKTQEEVVNNNADLLAELESYVQNYFKNLDVQTEINNKLDKMAQDGTLENLISQYLQLQTTFTYDSVNDMKNATNLINGCFTKTLGFYSYNDGGGAFYKIRQITNQDDVDEMFIIALNDTSLIAELIINDNKVNVKQCGVTGNSNDDATIKLTKLFNTKYDLYFPSGTYNTTSPLVLTSCKLIGEDVNTTIIKYNNETSHDELINSHNLNNLLIKDICFDCGSLKNILKTSINLYSTNGLKIINCEFKNGYGSHLRLNDSINILIENCYFHDIDGNTGNVGNAIYCHPASNLTVTKCKCERIMEDFIYLDGASDNPVKNIYINNNIITYTGYNNSLTSPNAIGINGNCQNIFIENNVMSNNVNSIKTDIRYEILPENINIINNIVMNNSQNGFSIKSNKNLISSNTILNCTQDGLYIHESNNTILSNNTIAENGRNGLFCRKSNYLHINDCVIYNNHSTGIIIGDNVNYPCNNVSLNNCEVYKTEDGTQATGIQIIYGDNVKMLSCRSYNNTVNYDVNRNTTNFVSQLNPSFTKNNIRSLMYSNTIPTGGIYNTGDIVLYDTPTASGYIGAVCVNGGAPGTWKEFGAISS